MGAGGPEVATAADVRPVSSVGGGASRWLRGFRVMTRWEFTGLRLYVPLMIGVQVLVGAGFVLGISLFFANTPPSVALFVSTGVPVLNLVIVGLIFGPQVVAEQKSQNGYEFLRVLLAPRSAAAAAWYTVTLVVSVPGVVASLLIAHLYYGVTFTITPAFAAAILLTSFTGTMMGYALAHAVDDPMRVRLVTQITVFAMMGFAPIIYPLEQMPGWLAAINWWLPFRHMAVIVRAALEPGLPTGVGTSYLIVAIWGVGCGAIAMLSLGRRR
jgi:ABC-2 type transport system permease protein